MKHEQTIKSLDNVYRTIIEYFDYALEKATILCNTAKQI